MDLTKIRRGDFPFCPLCGLYEGRQWEILDVEYRKGDWIYTGSFRPSQHAAFNVTTGEFLDVTADDDATGERPPAALIDRGLEPSPEHRLTPGQAAQTFAPISAIQEGCIVFNAAFIAAAVLLLVVGAALALRRPGRHRHASA